MKMMGLQLLFFALIYTPVIVAEDLDPVEFLISKNYPRNKSLIPLPKNFDKFGDLKNDCCALQLFIEVKDYNAEGTGNGDGYSDNESQTETGKVTFNFEHPAIRKSDIKFAMSVEKDKDKVKSKHLLNFDNCTNIEYKTFNISAITTIADDKDVRVVLVNGKDAKIVCTDPKSAPAPAPNLDPDPRDHYIFVLLSVIAALTIALILTLCIAYYFYRQNKEVCGKTFKKLTTSEKLEMIGVGGGQSESAACGADLDTFKDEKGEVKEKSSRTKKRRGRENPRAAVGASCLHAESGVPDQPTEENESDVVHNEKCMAGSKDDVSTKSDSDSDDEERGSVNNINSSGGQTRGKKTSTEENESDVVHNNEKFMSGSKDDVSSKSDSDSDDEESVVYYSACSKRYGTGQNDEERGSENTIKCSWGQTRGKKTSTEGVDKCGWITNIRKNNKPLFFSGVVICVWFVLCVITAGIMLPYIL